MTDSNNTSSSSDRCYSGGDLERAQADGKISAGDAETVREFADFLAAMPPKSDTSPEARKRRRKTLIRHADLAGLTASDVQHLSEIDGDDS